MIMNNILHLKYALEVEKTGSISKAAENLYMGQPHLSKAIRELEDVLGITIFNRTSKGVVSTQKGKEFLKYAKNILLQIDEMEALFKPESSDNQKFDISVPRASYISFAFTEFLKDLDTEKSIDLNYRETNSVRAIKNVADSINNLAIIRYQKIYERYFLEAIQEKELEYEYIWEFEYVALMSDMHPLAKEDKIYYSNLVNYTEIIHGDISVPFLPIAMARDLAQADDKKKKIAVFDRGIQFEILTRVANTYMWVSPMPKDVLSCFSLVQKKCAMSKNKYKDILIFRKGYHFTENDKLFLDKLRDTVVMVSNTKI